MADLNYQVDINTRNASRALDGLKSQILGFGAAVAGALSFREVTNIATRFEDLRITLQTLYKDTATGAAAFEDIKKFAQQSIFSVEALTETVVKLKAAGIEPTVAQLRLFANVSSVAADSVGALQAITDLYARTTAGGLGLEDLNRLADRGIPVFTILSERLGLSRLQISEVGKTAEGARIILKALEDGLQDAFGTASADRANTVSQAFSNFGDAIGTASDTLGQAGLNQGLVNFTRAVTELIIELNPLIKLIGEGLGMALNFLAENIKMVVAVLGGMLIGAIAKTAAAMARWVGIIAISTKSWQILNKVLLASPIGRIAAVLMAAAAAFGFLRDSTDEAAESTDDLVKSANELAASDGFKVFKDGNLGAGTENLRQGLRGLNEQLNKFKIDMETVVNQFKAYNEETLKSLNLETALIGASRETQELRRAELAINTRLAQEIARLTEQKAKLTEQEIKEGRGGIIDATIRKLQEQADVDKKATAEAIANSEARQRARQFELFSIQKQIDLEDDLMRIQDDIAKSTMSDIEQKYYDIERAAQRSALAAIRAEEARIGRPLSADEQKKYYDEAVNGINRVKSAAMQQYEQSRKFETGWKQAFRSYADDATNAAKQAQAIFQRVTQSMEDAIVNFAKTGKFEFKSFVNSIVEELLRSQIRQLIAQVFNIGSLGGGGGGGFLGSLGSLLGFANGGIIPTNRPVLVGERGPEILTGAGGRTVIPNDQLGGQTFVTYNINAVDAASFKSLIARDPAFIHAVAQQGANSLPRRR